MIAEAGISHNDLVVDIGAGDGAITRELVKRARHTVAIEIDPNLIPRLENIRNESKNVTIVKSDVLRTPFPKEKYKVVANIPFHLSTTILHKLLTSPNPPQTALLLLQKEAAQKYAGTPQETQFSLLAKPFFALEVLWRVKKSDFYPPPSVEVFALKINKRKTPLIAKADEALYTSFITYAFSRWKKNLKLGLSQIFTYNQWKRLSHDNGFPYHATPRELTVHQWIALFNFFKSIEIEQSFH